MKELTIDPVFKSLIPSLSDEEFKQLEENIKNDGCRDALVIWKGTIVDGHNRYQICRENGIPFGTEEKEFADRDEAAEWIIRNQFGRRNLSLAQRSELAMKLKPAIQKRAKENHAANGGDKKSARQKSNTPKIDTYDELAKIAGVSSDTIRKTEKIIDKGTPEQIERARKGGKGNSVNAIYNEVTGKQAPEKEPVKIKPKEEMSPISRNTTTEPEAEEEKIPEGYKVCNRCHTLMSLSAFEDSELNGYPDDVCGNCVRVSLETAGKRMRHKPRKKTKEERDRERAVLDQLYGRGEKYEMTIDDITNDFKGNFETFLKTMDITLKSFLPVIKDKENNKKIMAVLSEAVTTMDEWKGNYSYEKL